MWQWCEPEVEFARDQGDHGGQLAHRPAASGFGLGGLYKAREAIAGWRNRAGVTHPDRTAGGRGGQDRRQWRGVPARKCPQPRTIQAVGQPLSLAADDGRTRDTQDTWAIGGGPLVRRRMTAAVGGRAGRARRGRAGAPSSADSRDRDGSTVLRGTRRAVFSSFATASPARGARGKPAGADAGPQGRADAGPDAAAGS